MYIRHGKSSCALSQRVNSHIHITIDYINRHLFEDITLERLCGDLHLSKYYVCHLFKSTVGITMMQYITQRRVSEAKKPIASSGKTISEVANVIGFNSFSVFSRTFKRITGHTPLHEMIDYST